MNCLKAVVTHVRNEEYMLQWWIPHHAKKFDFGVVIDYNSTDKSMQMFKDLVPHWQIVPSRNKDFGALNCDIEVYQIEREIFRQIGQQSPARPYVMALNSTEFLIGDTNKLLATDFRTQKYIPCDTMVDDPSLENIEPDPKVPLFKQRYHGIQLQYKGCEFEPHLSHVNQETFKRKKADREIEFNNRVMRSIHNFSLNYMETSMYGTGRHYWTTPCEEFRILHYGYAPMTPAFIKRKMAVQTQIPITDLNQNIGTYQLVDERIIDKRLKYHQEFAKDLSQLISRYEP